MPPLASFYVSAAGDCVPAETVRAALLRRAANANQIKHRENPPRRSPASAPWSVLMDGEF